MLEIEGKCRCMERPDILAMPSAVNHLLMDGEWIARIILCISYRLCVYNFKTNFIKLFKKLDYVIIEVNLKYLLPESFLQSLLWNEEEIFWFS